MLDPKLLKNLSMRIRNQSKKESPKKYTSKIQPKKDSYYIDPKILKQMRSTFKQLHDDLMEVKSTKKKQPTQSSKKHKIF